MKIPAALQLPLALTLATFFNMGLFLLFAQPQLAAKQERQEQLVAELRLRERSLGLQSHAAVIEKIKTPLQKEQKIIAALQAAASKDQFKNIRYAFSKPQPAKLGNLSVTGQQLTLIFTDIPLEAGLAILQQLIDTMPNHMHLTQITHEDSHTRASFDIYGLPPT